MGGRGGVCAAELPGLVHPIGAVHPSHVASVARCTDGEADVQQGSPRGVLHPLRVLADHGGGAGWEIELRGAAHHFLPCGPSSELHRGGRPCEQGQ